MLLNARKKFSNDGQRVSSLKNYIGETLITTDGTTLLGASDKAVSVLEACLYLMAHPEITWRYLVRSLVGRRNPGKGAHRFKARAYACKLLNGRDWPGRLEYETFQCVPCSEK